MVSCRFAPSPTGHLHLGSMRTSLFNWAFARHNKGTFLLRIEDTDRIRSSAEYEQSIIDSLAWLNMKPDGKVVYQSKRGKLYQSLAMQLLEEKKAYRCYATPEELEIMRKEQEARGEKPMYDRRWRDRTDHPKDKPCCIRFATPISGVCEIDDLVRGKVRMDNQELDDPVILREDGSVTYNFAAAVDDGEMSITHVIRGEDHLTNTVRQVHIHNALGNAVPSFAHLPLILGRSMAADGTPKLDEKGNPIFERLSKRNLAIDVNHYRDEGYLPDAMVNYLSQLGWTHPSTEVYGPDELVSEFAITKVNKSAARFDPERLRWINWQHMRKADPTMLAKMAGVKASPQAVGMATEKAHTLVELKEELSWVKRPKLVDKDLLGHLGKDNRDAFIELCALIGKMDGVDASTLKKLIKDCCKRHGLGFAKLGMPLRVALTGKEQSPDIAEIAEVLGAKECRARLDEALARI